MRRFALISDIHGNLPALDAALADIGSRSLTTVAYCLGDLVGYGPDPAGVIERIRSLGIPTIRGNYDDGIGNRRGGCGCYYVTDQAKQDGAASYTFTDAALSAEDHGWLAALPDVLARTAVDPGSGSGSSAPGAAVPGPLPREAVIVLGLSGRGDKDLAALGLKEVGR